ncbi:hypothetical protein HPP92_002427 [Vanilla planifolia]|uniref:Radical SAM core domain-containing protein n=1 Tax=Vanilla planifolia TaxID=51239 RepID=A0A835S172_VANPL|nr:hypothetical protein HPP92_002427 [Vanilla planifolia]
MEDTFSRKTNFNQILNYVKEIREMGMEVCCTLGMLEKQQAIELKKAGLTAYNHNLDTSREYYPNIITTRSYDERLETLQYVHEAGISVCSGGIIGLGETEEDRVGLLHTLATLPVQPESIPINALVAVKGTPLQHQKPVEIWEMIRMIATARIAMPKAMVRLSAGRVRFSIPEQALCFLADVQDSGLDTKSSQLFLKQQHFLKQKDAKQLQPLPIESDHFSSGGYLKLAVPQSSAFEMSTVRLLSSSAFIAAVFLSYLSACLCQEDVVGAATDDGSASAVPYFTQVVYNRFMNYSDSFTLDISQHLGFCIKDPEKDWNGAFNFSADLGFLANCIKDTNGDVTSRLCTAAEIKFYFSSFFINGGKSNFLRPNRNCNITSWASGCEPGWACSFGENNKVRLNDASNIPSRTQDCAPCCEGFFCPHACPLGAYCPRAILNSTTGICDPYNYQPPPGQTNHSCGGADRWADVGRSGEMFCPAGYYCPNTVRKVSCTSGFYCRKGSTSQKRCFKKSSCKPNSSNQDITIFGALLMVALSLVLLIIYNFSGQVLTNRERKQAKSREAAARSARETVQAREKWKAAKDIAMKHAVGLHSQLSRTFSVKSLIKF